MDLHATVRIWGSDIDSARTFTLGRYFCDLGSEIREFTQISGLFVKFYFFVHNLSVIDNLCLISLSFSSRSEYTRPFEGCLLCVR